MAPMSGRSSGIIATGFGGLGRWRRRAVGRRATWSHRWSGPHGGERVGRVRTGLAGSPLLGFRHARRTGTATSRRGIALHIVSLPRLLRAGPRLCDARGENEVLAQRMSLEVLRK